MRSLDIAQRRLLSQRLSGPKLGTPGEATAWLAACQAQDFAGAKWAVGLRLSTATDAGLEQSFNRGEILRTHLLRPTWHFVTPADIRWLLELTAGRVHAVNAGMYRQAGLDGETFQRSLAALASALQGGQYQTRDELRQALQQAGVSTDKEFRMTYIMMHAELEGLVCSGPRRGKQFTYALLDERAQQAKRLRRDEALAELAQRYFTSRGPATVQDFAKWSGLTVAEAGSGLEAVKDQLEQEVVDGQVCWFAPGEMGAEQASPAVHLLSIYDEYISGYKDRSAMVAPDVGKRLMAMGAALGYIVVVDGQVVGTWRRTLKRQAVMIELNLMQPLATAEMLAVEAAAVRYGEFLGLKPELVNQR
jgi:hypothetical protein